MVAALANLAILVGAGVAGAVLAKEESLFSITDLFSGAFKIFRKHLQQDKAGSSVPVRPQNEFLLSQVNNLRQQLQSLQSSGPVTIVTGGSSGSGTFSVTAIIVVGAFGYGYIWWKGWKLPDMMFVTRRSLSDARNNVAKQLDVISSSISSTKRHLSSRIDRVDCSLNDCIDLSVATRDEVSNLHGELSGIHTEVENVHVKVRTLETKLGRIGGSQDLTTRGIRHLCEFVMNLERGRNQERIMASPSSARLALEPPTPATTTRSLPPMIVGPESSSPSPSVETPKVTRTITVSASGLKELQEASNTLRGGHFRSNPMRTGNSEVEGRTPVVQELDQSTSSSSRFGWKLPGLLSRTRSAS
uniref:30S ribosomal protein S5 n=1 Tax=Anthurium amnicola TaxID=1678845 RepID=A0A1D1XNJ3_9ARAE